jgi:hypothetical protein
MNGRDFDNLLFKVMGVLLIVMGVVAIIVLIAGTLLLWGRQ